MDEWDAEANVGLDPANLTLGSHKRVGWKCSKGHRWEATVGQRARGSKCPQCVRRALAKLPVISEHPILGPEFAADLNPDVDPNVVTIGSVRCLWWRCSEGDVWQATPDGRKNSRCGACQKRKRGARRTAYLSGNERAMRYFRQANNPHVSPSEWPLGRSRNLIWECASGHTWSTTVANLLRRRTNCSYCSGQKATPERCLAVTDPGLARQWHESNKRAATDVVRTSKYKAIWQGDCGHVWMAPVYVRSRGHGCIFCSGKSTAEEQSIAATHPFVAQDWDHRDNGGVRPLDVSAGSNVVATWRCITGHKWRTSVANRCLNGTSCPQCERITRRSMREIRLAHELAVALGADPVPERLTCGPGQAWDVDFASREYRVVVEYDGAFYHSRPGYAERDRRKSDQLGEAGWTVIRVRERPLPALHPWDVLCGHTGPIRPVVDDVIERLLAVRPDLSTLPGLMAYRSTRGPQAAQAADEEIDRLRQAQTGWRAA